MFALINIFSHLFGVLSYYCHSTLFLSFSFLDILDDIMTQEISMIRHKIKKRKKIRNIESPIKVYVLSYLL